MTRSPQVVILARAALPDSTRRRTHRLVTLRKEGRIAFYHLLDGQISSLIDSALDHVREEDP